MHQRRNVSIENPSHIFSGTLFFQETLWVVVPLLLRLKVSRWIISSIRRESGTITDGEHLGTPLSSRALSYSPTSPQTHYAQCVDCPSVRPEEIALIFYP